MLKYYLSSFQTRNVPHFGHEEIMKRLIKLDRKSFYKSPHWNEKKRCDFNFFEILRKIFNNLIKNVEYKNKVLFWSFYCKYALCRSNGEAIHHLNLREMIGFDRFTIGRDHAGAENIYKPLEAFNYVKKFSKKLKIDIF